MEAGGVGLQLACFSIEPGGVWISVYDMDRLLSIDLVLGSCMV